MNTRSRVWSGGHVNTRSRVWSGGHVNTRSRVWSGGHVNTRSRMWSGGHVNTRKVTCCVSKPGVVASDAPLCFVILDETRARLCVCVCVSVCVPVRGGRCRIWSNGSWTHEKRVKTKNFHTGKTKNEGLRCGSTAGTVRVGSEARSSRAAFKSSPRLCVRGRELET